MKICYKCKSKKEVTEFNKNASRKDGLQTMCRLCDNKRKRTYYQNRKDKFISYNSKKKYKIAKWFEEYKRTLKCSKCDDTRWYVLDFHHEDPSTKTSTLSKLVRQGYSKEVIMLEVSKCIVLCSNCHREEHHNQKMGL